MPRHTYIHPYTHTEDLIGKKMDLFTSEEDIVLQLSERVNEAQRVATQTLKEMELKKVNFALFDACMCAFVRHEMG